MSPQSCVQRSGGRSQWLQPTTDHAADNQLVDVAVATGKSPTCPGHSMGEEHELAPAASDDSNDIERSCSLSTDIADVEAVRAKKTVRWSTITIHEFGVGLGGSAVSNKGGPSIGLADTPEFTWTTKVGDMAECCEGVHRFSPNQRIRLLQAAGVPEGIITRHARETNIILGSRRRSTTTWDESELEELEEECKEPPRKRSADQAMLERPCSVYLRRPRMIPANYV
ncbi:hypothetical protein BBJ28_00005468 [Nothophytophthora sp. Chile5]|nr:hypothetical protein BBJ28_00005468 [Nothophytophthora sp. Chile5]